MKKYEFDSKLDKNSTIRLKEPITKKNSYTGCLITVLIIGGLTLFSSYFSSSTSKNTTSVNNNGDSHW